ncbi:MAG: hypothetical protein FWF52_01405 [Candidatus Azobacteroides sp.]|nr:hypothetical protein [Candidatus Azobacteroides sp.]
MKKSRNLVKNTIFVLLIFILFSSCKNQKTINSLPIDRISVIEYRYLNVNEWKFQIVGFSEMDKNFNLKSVLYGYDGFYYCNSNIIIPDSIKDKISKIILNYQLDTAFLYTKGPRIYDGNSYRFVIEKNNKEKTEIKFEPEFLPSDLLILYKYLYEDQQDSLKKNSYEDLFNKFEEQVKSEVVR